MPTTNNTPKTTSSFAWRRWGAIVTVALLVAIGAYAVIAWANNDEAAVTEFMHLHGLNVPGWAPESVYVSTHTGLIRLTPESKWEQVSSEPHDFMGFQAHPSEAGVMYSSGHPAPGSGLPNPVGFMISRDGGMSWEIRNLAGQVDFHTSTVQPTNGNVYYGYAGDLFRTTDSGQTWTQTPRDHLARIGTVYALAVDSHDSSTVLAGTDTGLWRSPDAGVTWQALLQGAPVTAVATTASDTERVLAYAVARDGGLIESTDGGASWTSLGFLAQDGDAVGYIAPHPTDDATLVLGTFGESILRSRNGGRTWTVLADSGAPETHPADHEGEHQH